MICVILYVYLIFGFMVGFVGFFVSFGLFDWCFA